jgi:hypothetical protein
MNKLPYICVPITHEKEINFNSLLEAVVNTCGKKMKEVLLGDFILNKPDGYDLNHGVYIFKDSSSNIMYVGKASSRPFIERIPAHLDTRARGWFNYMLKIISIENSPNDYLKESLDVLENYELLLVLFSKEENNLKEKISQTERFLINNTACLNKKK